MTPEMIKKRRFSIIGVVFYVAVTCAITSGLLLIVARFAVLLSLTSTG